MCTLRAGGQEVLLRGLAGKSLPWARGVWGRRRPLTRGQIVPEGETYAIEALSAFLHVQIMVKGMPTSLRWTGIRAGMNESGDSAQGKQGTLLAGMRNVNWATSRPCDGGSECRCFSEH